MESIDELEGLVGISLEYHDYEEVDFKKGLIGTSVNYNYYDAINPLKGFIGISINLDPNFKGLAQKINYRITK